MEKKGHIFFIVFGILVFVFLGAAYYFKNNTSQPEVIEQPKNEQTGNNKVVGQEEKKSLNDEEAKKLFKATEIVSNNLPNSIEFWTEATCPGDGFNSDYIFSNFDASKYHFNSCTEGDIGSHGGCPTCEMGKIKLISSNCEDDNEKYYKSGSDKFLIQVFHPNCNLKKCQIKIFGKGITQTIDNTNNSDSCNGSCCQEISFEDYNFDGYNDLRIFNGEIGAGSGRLNESNDIFLFDNNKKSFVYNDNISGSHPSVDKNNKEVSLTNIDFGSLVYTGTNFYKWINGEFKLIRNETTIDDGSGKICRKKISDYINNQWVNKATKEGDCDKDLMKNYDY